jgi:hypothetical protein
MTNPKIVHALAKLNALIQVDSAGRGLARGEPNLFSIRKDDFAAAVLDLAAHPLPRLLIVTGFPIALADPPGTSETDGPSGALFLAETAIRLGFQPVLAADGTALAALRVGLASRGLQRQITVVDLSALPREPEKQADALKRWQGDFTHLISIERAGATHSFETAHAAHPELDKARFDHQMPEANRGKAFSMRGVDLSPWNFPAHGLFEYPDSAWTTVGIGDGGNELGMGLAGWELIADRIPNGGAIACRVKTNHLIVCGVSNWGGWALGAGWAIAKGKKPSWLDSAREQKLLALMVDKGPLVDGVTSRKLPTIDGLAWYHHARLIQAMIEVAEESLEP